jgi:GINS complex subunit 2
MLLDAASDDLTEPDQVRRLLKDLREVRMAKMRKRVDVLDTAAVGGGGVLLTGVGAMEVGEMRGFVAGVVEGLRKIGASREQARREQLAEEGPNQDYDGTQDDDDDMEL